MPAHASSHLDREWFRRPRATPAAPHTPSAAARDASPPARRACPVALVRRARQGDRRAFDALWLRYAATVHGILLTMLDDDDAEDVAQDVAIAAFRSLASLEKPASFPSWLCAIARNHGRDALAARRRSRESPLDDAVEPRAADTGDPTLADEIVEQIRSLPECYREPLMLRLLLEMPGPEIAARTGRTEGSVRVNLCRGMKLLRARLKRWELP